MDSVTQKSSSFLKVGGNCIGITLQDIALGLAASVFLGLGSFFLLQWCGIYV